jgi:hypothetical protein
MSEICFNANRSCFRVLRDFRVVETYLGVIFRYIKVVSVCLRMFKSNEKSFERVMELLNNG